MKTTQYTQEVQLEHNEVACTMNNETGEVKQVKKRFNNIPEGMEIFEPNAIFRKDYTVTWNFLKRELKPLEFQAAFTMALFAKANTNTLEPLDDNSTIPELMEVLNVSKNKVKPILERLFELGVYARFEAQEAYKPYTKYWVFNPYLSFSGKVLRSDIAHLFKATHVGLAFFNPNHRYSK